MNIVNENWTKLLQTLQAELNPQEYQAWFNPLSVYSKDGDALTILVPTRHHFNWIETHYLDLFQKNVKAVFGNNVKVFYKLAASIPTMHKEEAVDSFHRSASTYSAPSAPAGVPQRAQLPTFQQPASLPQYKASKPVQQTHGNPLQADNLLSNFVVGDSNRFAYAAALRIAEQPGSSSFNPFVIHSGVGLGKTHLIQGIGNKIVEQNPKARICYITADRFMTQFVNAYKENALHAFVDDFQSLDVLILDDIQVLAGKTSTLENFFQIFNQLHQLGKQIILTTDTPLSEIKGFHERLLSRLKWGSTAEIKKPDYQTRYSIAESKAQLKKLDISKTLLEHIARKVDTNVRELEGVLTSLSTRSQVLRCRIDQKMVDEILANTIETRIDREITIEEIEKAVIQTFSVSKEQLHSRARTKLIADARQIAMFLTHTYTDLPLKSIGLHFGKRDHTTVIHACKTFEMGSNKYLEYQSKITEVLQVLHLH